MAHDTEAWLPQRKRRGFRVGSRTAGAAGMDFRGRQVSPWSQRAPSAMTTEDILNSHPSKEPRAFLKGWGQRGGRNHSMNFVTWLRKLLKEGENWVELELSFYFKIYWIPKSFLKFQM